MMRTRLEKFNQEEIKPIKSRTSKNTQLYEEIKNSELNEFNIGTNAKVIGESDSQINIDKIKEILEKNYQDPPKRRSLKFDVPEQDEIEIEKTREYDINAILEKAREEKEIDYSKERLKKVRDTQFDILKSLELDNEENQKASQESAKEELLELINTINMNEKQKKEIQENLNEESTQLDPLDLFTDLRGDENTVVAGAKEFAPEETSPSPLINEEIKETKESSEKEEIKDALDEELDDSFYTNSMTFKKNDFASLEDNESGAINIIVRILIILVFLAIIAGVVLFLNEFLSLGWF
ncbi:MAG: hypothetical protein IJ772_05790 [Bacilli bacterium]|nr:hypothetical protein [Bacilli bacterium]